MLSADRANERPAPIRLPPSRPHSSINLISDEPNSPVRPRSATVSPSIVARKNNHEDKVGHEADERRPSLPGATHRLQTPWPKKDEIRLPRAEVEVPRRGSPTTVAGLLAPREIGDIPAIEAETGATGAEAPRRHSDTPIRSLPERQEPDRKKSMTTAASISCAYCTATGVNLAWRRDRSGKPLCGRCCEQLRRRMNPRQVSYHNSEA